MFKFLKFWGLRKRRREHLEGYKWAMDAFFAERHRLELIELLLYNQKSRDFDDFDRGAAEAVMLLEKLIASSKAMAIFETENGE